MSESRWRYQRWPLPYVGVPIEIGQSALMLVDMQRYWTDSNGPIAKLLQERYPEAFQYFYDRLAGTVVPNLVRLIGEYRQQQRPIVYITSGTMRSDGRDLSPHLQRRIASGNATSAEFQLLRIGSKWHEMTPQLVPQPDDLLLNKTTRSAFHSTGVDQLLRNLGVKHLLVSGLASNGCVDLTARDAADHGYETFLLEDACVTFSEEAHAPVFRAFQEVFGTVLTVDDVLRTSAALRR